MTMFPHLSIAAALFSLTVPAAAATTPKASGDVVFVAGDHPVIGALALPDRSANETDRRRDLVTMTSRDPAPRSGRTRKIFTKDEFRGYSGDLLGPDLIFWGTTSPAMRKPR